MNLQRTLWESKEEIKKSEERNHLRIAEKLDLIIAQLTGDDGDYDPEDTLQDLRGGLEMELDEHGEKDFIEGLRRMEEFYSVDNRLDRIGKELKEIAEGYRNLIPENPFVEGEEPNMEEI